MPPEYPADDNEAFDPFRHRKEIELMEQRFRERVERSENVPPPPTTGAIDEQVQDEMRQFFTASTSLLEEVVPTLQARHGHDPSETTGEIRRKIDEFFGESAGGMIRAERTGESGADASLPPPVQSYHRPGEPAPESESQPVAPSYGAPPAHHGGMSATESRGYPDGDDIDTVSPLEAGAIRRAENLEPAPPVEPQENVRASLPRPARRSARGRAERPPMDLKSALERLRKHGVVRDAQAAEPPPAPPPAVPARRPVPQAAQEPSQSATQPLNGTDVGAVAALRGGDVRPDTPAMERPPVSTPPPPPPVDTSRIDGFDDIFAEVEGLVRGTLADSVQETFAEARHQESALRAQLSSSAVASHPVDRPPPLSSMLPRPAEDEVEDEEAPDEEAAAAPYDWGVKPAARPAGAWLLEEGAEDAVRERMGREAPSGPPTEDLLEDTGEIEVTVTPTSLTAAIPRGDASTAADRLDGPAPPPTTGGAGAGPAGGILARKLEAESTRFAPMLDRLMADGVVSESEIDDEEDGGDDDEISVAEFVDNRPRGDDQGMTPMRIVEEIRRLRRIQELLVAKGLVSEGEITSPSPSDD
jgi:hypothetical protein